MSGVPRQTGKVYLVGAGPGDPKLLTLRGKECLAEADVVLYDYLANPVLLDYVPAEAERIYVGRRGRGRYQDQADVNRLIIERARSGKIVVRLKGGDPFVFGRGGEEAEAVAEAGLPFEVVPGVTSAIAVPAYAGIPVTHRTMASTVSFVAGHEDPGKGGATLDWPRLATADGTLVFLMGVKNLRSIVSNLLSEGKSGDTPVAVIRWGTKNTQQTVVGTLENIVGKTADASIEPPALMVVGQVVRLRERLNWFEARPLFGKRILVTRAKEQAAELSNLLMARGAEPIECPMIQIQPPESWAELDAAVSNLSRYQWLVFTSVNGVRPFMERLRLQALDARALAGLRLCCIGPRTAEELIRYGLRPDLVPDEFQAEGMIRALTDAGVAGHDVLIPRAAVARELLPEQLTALGARVTVVTAYRTVLPPADRDRLTDMLRQGGIDMLTFTSSSTVRNFRELFATVEEMKKLSERCLVACIGPITADTARAVGLIVGVVASENTIPALVDSLIRHAAGTHTELSPPTPGRT